MLNFSTDIYLSCFTLLCSVHITVSPNFTFHCHLQFKIELSHILISESFIIKAFIYLMVEGIKLSTFSFKIQSFMGHLGSVQGGEWG